MDLTRQAETMIDLLASGHTEEDDIFHKFHLSQRSNLYVAWLWDGILLWGNVGSGAAIRLAVYLHSEKCKIE